MAEDRSRRSSSDGEIRRSAGTYRTSGTGSAGRTGTYRTSTGEGTRRSSAGTGEGTRRSSAGTGEGARHSSASTREGARRTASAGSARRRRTAGGSAWILGLGSSAARLKFRELRAGGRDTAILLERGYLLFALDYIAIMALFASLMAVTMRLCRR